MQEVLLFLSAHGVLVSALVVVIVLLVMVEIFKLKQRAHGVTPAQAVLLINRQHAAVIDIRNAEAYGRSHIIDAQSFPLDQFQTQIKKLEKYKNKPVLIVCDAGLEANKIAAKLLKQGYQAFALSGGLRAWMEADLPLAKGKDKHG